MSPLPQSGGPWLALWYSVDWSERLVGVYTSREALDADRTEEDATRSVIYVAEGVPTRISNILLERAGMKFGDRWFVREGDVIREVQR